MSERKKNALPDEGLNLLNLMETLFYRDEFLTIASHELKTPLTALKLQAQVFKRNAMKEKDLYYSKEKVNQLIDQMETQATRLSKLVDDMLDVSRIRSGLFSLNTIHFNLSQLLMNIRDQLSILESSQISFTISPDIFMTGDPDRLAQVFHQLIQNALKYGNSRPIQVSLCVKRGKIIFSVKDSGRGISEEDQSKIFNRFQRAVAASEISGLGLGLYIAKEIVESHKGSITIQSKIGIGSVFTATFKKLELP
jgi:signal transduction histidine kinase